jgi:hypothetical protein
MGAEATKLEENRIIQIATSAGFHNDWREEYTRML